MLNTTIEFSLQSDFFYNSRKMQKIPILLTGILLIVSGVTTQDFGPWNCTGPVTPIDDPYYVNGPTPANVSYNPIFQILEGSTYKGLNITGLSTLRYVNIVNSIILHESFSYRVDNLRLSIDSYDVEGYIDVRPLREETFPSGNFSGSGSAQISLSGFKMDGNATWTLNVITNKIWIASMNITTLAFDSLSVDFGEVTVGGNFVDWGTLSENLKSNFDSDWENHVDEITEQLRFATNYAMKDTTYNETIEYLRDNCKWIES